MQLDFASRELTLKLVYYGPALSGKTTNLQALFKAAGNAAAGRLMTLETKDDRTLFFDLLPLTFKAGADVTVRLKVFTVPGQVVHAATRRLVVQGADGVVFVADSQVASTAHNGAAFKGLRDNLKTNGTSLRKMPLVIQFNKRDMPGIRSDEEVAGLARQGREPVYLAVATRGEGVVETFMGLLCHTWQHLERDHDIGTKLGIDGKLFLSEVCARLGRTERLETVIGTFFAGGGHFRPAVEGTYSVVGRAGQVAQ